MTTVSGARPATATDALSQAGVSIWLDDLSRRRLVTGGLQRLVDERGVVGVTTNPTIFARALTEGGEYAQHLERLARDGASVEDAILELTTDDVRAAADVLRPVHDRTEGEDGWVSIEVGAEVAHDAEATLREARRLRDAVGRPNAFIKIPATRTGVEAIRRAIGEGISVNVTLLFSLTRYDEVIDAYLSGLERAVYSGLDPAGIRSVASFFVSRVDTAVDAQLDALGTPEARELRGRAGIANARLAYELFERRFESERAQRLLAEGAHVQRPLWASTGMKDPRRRDTEYVEELIAPGVVNTMPEKTLEAFADHGVVRGDTVTGGYQEARLVLVGLASAGVSYEAVTEQLERDGIRLFAESGAQLRAAIQRALEDGGGPSV